MQKYNYLAEYLKANINRYFTILYLSIVTIVFSNQVLLCQRKLNNEYMYK